MKKVHSFVICLCLSIIAMYAIVASIYSVELSTAKETSLNTKFSQADEINSRWLEEIKSQDIVIDDSEPIFSNAVEALTTAYNNLINAKSWYVTCHGDSVASSTGVSTYINFDNEYFKHTDGTYTTDSASFVGAPFSSASISRQKYFSNTELYMRKADTTVMQDGKITPKFSAEFKKCGLDSECAPLDDFYYTTKNTITKTNYYKVVRDPLTNAILGYDVSVELNPTTSTVEYGITLKKSGEFINVPKFQSVSLVATISPDGYYKSVNVSEVYNCRKVIVILGDVSALTKVNSYYSFSKYGKEIEKPSFVELAEQK